MGLNIPPTNGPERHSVFHLRHCIKGKQCHCVTIINEKQLFVFFSLLAVPNSGRWSIGISGVGKPSCLVDFIRIKLICLHFCRANIHLKMQTPKTWQQNWTRNWMFSWKREKKIKSFFVKEKKKKVKKSGIFVIPISNFWFRFLVLHFFGAQWTIL